jgi:uncharacterized repeat protein (TIGR01451 family)
MHHSDVYNMDYPWLNWSAYEASGPQPTAHDYVALVAENAWLRLTFLPELGGRLYGVTIKETGEELLYQNPVIKPTHWGPPEQPWWLAAGGMEWCLPVEEHGYEWAVPWEYGVSADAEGATVTLRDTTATDRVRAKIQVHLPADKAAFLVTPRLENPTTTAVSFKYWGNAALAPGAVNTISPDLRFVLPNHQVTVHSRGDDHLPGPGAAMEWPIHNGTDYSRLGNWNHWLGFFARPQAVESWTGVYDEGLERGVARVFPHQVAVGVKGFGLGWANPIDPGIWTDDGSAYVELHGGPAPTFWDAITLGPGESVEWTESWLPLEGLPNLSLATTELALGVSAIGEDLDIGLQVAGALDGVGLRLWRGSDCALLWRADGLDLSPGEVFRQQLSGLGLVPEEVVLGVVGDGRVLALTGELECPVPSSQVDPLDAVQTTADFVVSWSGIDPGGVLDSYDVQVREGDADASWGDWLTSTTAISSTFWGRDGHTYTFRSRARDLFGGLEPWPIGQWQDASTTVLLGSEPLLMASEKVVQPLHVQPGDVAEFQIHLRNTGNLTASVQITDPLPVHLSLIGGPYITPDSLAEPVFVDGIVTWEGPVASGQTDVVIGFDTQVLSLGPGGIITNVVWIDDGVHPVLLRLASTRGRAFLPVIAKTYRSD